MALRGRRNHWDIFGLCIGHKVGDISLHVVCIRLQIVLQDWIVRQIDEEQSPELTECFVVLKSRVAELGHPVVILVAAMVRESLASE